MSTLEENIDVTAFMVDPKDAIIPTPPKRNRSVYEFLDEVGEVDPYTRGHVPIMEYVRPFIARCIYRVRVALKIAHARITP